MVLFSNSKFLRKTYVLHDLLDNSSNDPNYIPIFIDLEEGRLGRNIDAKRCVVFFLTDPSQYRAIESSYINCKTLVCERLGDQNKQDNVKGSCINVASSECQRVL